MALFDIGKSRAYEFREAASFQIPSLGFEPKIVWVPHSVQNRLPDELEQLAEDALDAVLRGLTSGPARCAWYPSEEARRAIATNG